MFFAPWKAAIAFGTKPVRQRRTEREGPRTPTRRRRPPISRTNVASGQRSARPPLSPPREQFRPLPRPRAFDRPGTYKSPQTPRTTPTEYLEPDLLRSTHDPTLVRDRAQHSEDPRRPPTSPASYGANRVGEARPPVGTSRPQSMASYASLLTISSSFDLLFRVLFTFPSQYFCAIGLVAIFSFGWDQPPVLGLQSQTTRLKESRTPRPRSAVQGFHLLRPTFRGKFRRLAATHDLQSKNYNSVHPLGAHRFQA